jgi:glycosyltransferase involved in cell wall biosynthesis
MYSLVEYAGFWYILSKAIAAAIVLIWNFWASKMFVFNKKFINKKDQIIIASEIFPPDIGGPATYSYRLTKHLIQQGYDIKIICYSTVLPDKLDEEFGRRIVRISSLLSLPVKYFLYFIKLFNVALQAKVIYAQGPVASGWPALLVCKILRKKLVVKVVGDYSWEQARFYYATTQGINDWQTHQEFKSKKLSVNLKLKFINFIQKTSVRNAQHVIVPSYYLKKIVIGWGVKPDKIKVIYNSVEFDARQPISLRQAQKKIKINGDLIISGGRMMPWKGFELFIRLMPELKKVNPKFKLVIFGSGPEYKRLKILVSRLKLDKDVVLTGQIHHQDLYYYYLASSLFVLNSSYEGLSHVILDAMYYHLPIIASNAGGNPELIQDDYNGCLVEYNNKQEWLSAIIRIWQNEKIRQRFCASPLVKLDVFNFKHMVQETIKILDS